MSAPLRLLVDDPAAGETLPLPALLARQYAGHFALPERCLYANMVTTLDGVAAQSRDHRNAGSAISGHNASDRFVMALLRACAGAVLIGAGTLRTTPKHRWTAAHLAPDLGTDFAQLRGALQLAPQPALAVLTASGDVDVQHPGLRGGIVFTTESGAQRLRDHTPADVSVHALASASHLDVRDAVGALRALGHQRILSEGGPSLLGELLQEDLLDELFLSLTPRLAGRSSDSHALGLVEVSPRRGGLEARFELASARRGDASLLLLRYTRVRAAAHQ